MGAVALGSVRSSAVTTLALALAATWPPARRVLLVEADPAGGTLSAAAGWPPEPGLVSLAAASRRGLTPALLWEHCQELPGGQAVLAGPASAAQAAGALSLLAGLATCLISLEADVIADCGRLDPGSRSLDLFERAGRQVLVTRPRLADLHALVAWAETLPSPLSRALLVVVGDGGYPDSEIEGALSTEVACRLPWDARAAGALCSVAASDRELRLAPLVRSARTLADRLANEVVEPTRTAQTADAAGDGELAHDEPLEPAPARRPAAKLAVRALRVWRPAPAPAPASANGNGASEVSE